MSGFRRSYINQDSRLTRFFCFLSFMSDQEAWHELSNLYMAVNDYTKAAFCMEEVLLHNPHSHLIHQRLGEIRYTMVGHGVTC